MSDIRWNLLKNDRLKQTRGVSFENILEGKPIGIKKHLKRKNQNIILFYYKHYIWIVPYILEENGDILLKTLYPSRKYTKMFKEGKI